MWRNNMIKLMDIINESIRIPEHRLSLARIQVNMEKILPELTATQNNKLTQLFTELSEMATHLNSLPYTKFNYEDWKLYMLEVEEKVNELHEAVQKIADKKKDLNCQPLIIAIQETLGY